MVRAVLILVCILLSCRAYSQDMVYSNLQELLSGRGDTVTTLAKERRTVSQIYLSGGADYQIYSTDNAGFTKYLKKRSFAVRCQDTLYVNCKQVRYKKYRFGNWFAKAAKVRGHVFFVAQPLGQIASSSVVSKDVPRLQGSVGDAISASGLVYDRVVYEIFPDGNVDFVGRERMKHILASDTELLDDFLAQDSESADVVMKYLMSVH